LNYNDRSIHEVRRGNRSTAIPEGTVHGTSTSGFQHVQQLTHSQRDSVVTNTHHHRHTMFIQCALLDTHNRTPPLTLKGGQGKAVQFLSHAHLIQGLENTLPQIPLEIFIGLLQDTGHAVTIQFSSTVNTPVSLMGVSNLYVSLQQVAEHPVVQPLLGH